MDKKKYNLFLDDDPNRIPHKLSWISLPLVEWVIVRNYNDFVETIKRDGMPERISFDHDLADEHYKEYHAHRADNRNINYDHMTEKTGFHCAQWLAQYCVDNNIKIPEYYTHTLNPVGAENIKSILESARKIINEANKIETKCKCGNPGTTELHSCPYQSDINGDDTDRCNCCANCCQNCAMDI